MPYKKKFNLHELLWDTSIKKFFATIKQKFNLYGSIWDTSIKKNIFATIKKISWHL